LAYHHDVIVLVFNDPLERNLPDVGLVRMEDAETGEIMWIDTHASNWQRNFSAQTQQLQDRVRAATSQAHVDVLQIGVNDDYVARLVTLFQRRVGSRH